MATDDAARTALARLVEALGQQNKASGLVPAVLKALADAHAVLAAPPEVIPRCATCQSVGAGLRVSEPQYDLGNGCVICAYQNHLAILEERLRVLTPPTPPEALLAAHRRQDQPK